MKYFLLRFLCQFIPVKKYRKKFKRKFKNICNSKPFFEAVLASVDTNKWKEFKIIESNLGEAVIFALTYKNWWNGEMVVLTKKYHLDVFKMLAPEVPVIFCKEKSSFWETSEYKKHIFSFVLSNHDLGQMNLTQKHLFENWQNYLGKNLQTQKYSAPVVSEEARKSALQKLNKMGLSLDNLIFVSDEALSLSPLPEEFWTSVTNAIKDKKYQIFINKSKGDNTLTIEETYFVATQCKMIIALRSGLIDLLCMINKPLRIIYTTNPAITDIQPMYDLTKFPFCTKDIIEYNTNTDSVENIKNQIIKEIKSL